MKGSKHFSTNVENVLQAKTKIVKYEKVYLSQIIMK